MQFFPLVLIVNNIFNYKLKTMQNLPADSMLQDEHEIRATDAICINESEQQHLWYFNMKYILVGLVFGILFVIIKLKFIA